MKVALMKTLTACAGLLLVVPFVGLALMIGTRALTHAGGARGGWLLIALALGGTLVSGTRGARLRHTLARFDALHGRRAVLRQPGC